MPSPKALADVLRPCVQWTVANAHGHYTIVRSMRQQAEEDLFMRQDQDECSLVQVEVRPIAVETYKDTVARLQQGKKKRKAA